jgi:AcrR family transcriptional regulator
MSDTTLTPEMILASAEEVLRRFGPTKATVIDVARALGVSHGSVYRHFASKAALRDAVTERWLARVAAPLAAVVTDRGPAIPRLRHWFELLMASKRSLAQEDPELFATYMQLANEARGVVNTHVNILVQQIAQIIADGIIRGEFAAVDPAIAARALFDATMLFHNPVHAAEWSNPDIEASFDGVWYLALRGLRREPQTRTRRGLPPQGKGSETKTADK